MADKAHIRHVGVGQLSHTQALWQVIYVNIGENSYDSMGEFR